jgi:hypothetical protein
VKTILNSSSGKLKNTAGHRAGTKLDTPHRLA